MRKFKSEQLQKKALRVTGDSSQEEVQILSINTDETSTMKGKEQVI